LEQVGRSFHLHLKNWFKSTRAVLAWCMVSLEKTRSTVGLVSPNRHRLVPVGLRYPARLSMYRVVITDAGQYDPTTLLAFVRESLYRIVPGQNGMIFQVENECVIRKELEGTQRMHAFLRKQSCIQCIRPGHRLSMYRRVTSVKSCTPSS
jgi:hypothetical protein